jgi:transposase
MVGFPTPLTTILRGQTSTIWFHKEKESICYSFLIFIFYYKNKREERKQMLVKTILNDCQDFKGFIYESIKLNAEGTNKKILVGIRPHRRSRPVCSGCGISGSCYDTSRKPRTFEFVPLWGYPVFFIYYMRRLNCSSCGVKTETVPWADGKKQLTKTYMQVLASWCKSLSWAEVSRRFQTSWEKVFHSVEYVVNWGIRHRSLEDITAIGVDEILWHRGHKYLTVVYQINSNSIRLLWIGKNRTVKSFLKFFRLLGKVRTGKLETLFESH